MEEKPEKYNFSVRIENGCAVTAVNSKHNMWKTGGIIMEDSMEKNIIKKIFLSSCSIYICN